MSAPLVAIGGISLESGKLLVELGADGIAVISDICKAESPVQRASQWVQRFPTRQSDPGQCRVAREAGANL